MYTYTQQKAYTGERERARVRCHYIKSKASASEATGFFRSELPLAARVAPSLFEAVLIGAEVIKRWPPLRPDKPLANERTLLWEMAAS